MTLLIQRGKYGWFGWVSRSRWVVIRVDGKRFYTLTRNGAKRKAIRLIEQADKRKASTEIINDSP